MPSDQLSDLATDRIAVKHATSSYTSDRCSAGLMWRDIPVRCVTRYLFTYIYVEPSRALSVSILLTAIAAERLTVMSGRLSGRRSGDEQIRFISIVRLGRW
jgi:hypothetical protein